MRINTYGTFVLNYNKRIYNLKFGANLICVQNNKLYIDKTIIGSDCSFVINIEDESASLIKLDDNITDLDFQGNIARLKDNVCFSINNSPIVFYFKYEVEKLDSIIDAFMDGVLTFPLNMENIFYDYAQQLKITDKKAISNVMAAIDIPEIDKI